MGRIGLALPARPAWASGRRIQVLALMLSLLGVARGAAASEAPVGLPSGPDVITGSVGFSSAPSALNITQTTNKAIINWSDFSISVGSSVVINNGTGATLNRVVGNDVSAINGMLSATGSVFVINPNGVIIGKNGVVNTGGSFIASSLDVANIDFLTSSSLGFRGRSEAKVLNQGHISSAGGDVALVGAAVENQGQLLAPNGTVAMGAGSSLVLSDGGGLTPGLLNVEIGGAGSSVTNSGLIEAATVELRAQGGNIYALAGNSSGVIRATGIESRGGHIWLVSEAGATSVAGVLEAKGADGAPGDIETSGRDLKIGVVDVNTHGGTWLLDPTDLHIDSVAAASIVTALDAGTNVTEKTTGSIGQYGLASLPANGHGDIFVSSSIAWTGAGVLTLDALRSVIFHANVQVLGAGGVVIKYGGGDPAGDLHFGAGASLRFSLTDPAQSLSINGQTYSLIGNRAQFLTDVNANQAGHFALANDISMGGPALTAAAISQFSGVLEGLGNAIDNLQINAPTVSSVGLIGSLTGTVRDLRLTGGGAVTGLLNVGAIAGSGSGSILNVVSDTTVSGRAFVGGLVGFAQANTIKRSVVSGSVFYTVNDGYYGGIVGINGNNSLIEDSIFSGSVSGYDLVGGVTGRNSPGSIIRNVLVSGSFSGVLSNTALISPINDAGSSIFNSSSTTVVTALVEIDPVGPFNVISLTPVNWTVADASSDYGTLAVLGAATLSGVSAGDSSNVVATVGLTTSLGAPVTLSNRLAVGSYLQIVTGLTGTAASSYALASTGNTAGTLIVRPLVLIGVLSTGSSVYGGSLSPGTLTFTNLVAGDSVTGGAVVVNTTGLTSSSGRLVAGAHPGIESVGSSLSGADAANYSFAGATGAYTVLKATLTASLAGTVTRDYDGTTAAVLSGGNFALSGVVSGDAVAVSSPTTGLYDTKAVGSGKTVTVTGLGLSGADAANYSVGSTVSGPVGQITAKMLTASLTGLVSKTYDGTTAASLSAGNYALSGVVGGDVVTLIAPTSGAYDTKAAGSGKTVTTTGLGLGGADAANYTVGSAASGAVGQISPLSITASLTGSVTKAYDGTASATLNAGSYTLSGLLGGDGVTLSAASGLYDSKAVGAGKTVTFTGLGLGGADGANYTVISTISGAMGQITPKTLTASLSGPVTKTYDGSAAATLGASAYALGGLVAGDAVTLTAATGLYDTKVVGSGKAVTFTGLGLSGADAANYTVAPSVSGGVGQITPKTLTASLTGLVSKVYDGTLTATLSAGNYALSGVVTSDAVALNNPSLGLYDTIATGTGKTVTVAGLGLSGADAANYVVATTVSGAVGRIFPAASQISSAGALASPSPISQLQSSGGRAGGDGSLMSVAPGLIQTSGLEPLGAQASAQSDPEAAPTDAGPPEAGPPEAGATELAAADNPAPERAEGQSGSTSSAPRSSASSPASSPASSTVRSSISAAAATVASRRSASVAQATNGSVASKAGGRPKGPTIGVRATDSAAPSPGTITTQQANLARRTAIVAAATRAAATRGNESQPGDQLAESFHDNVWLDNSSLDEMGQSRSIKQLNSAQSLSNMIATFVLILVP
ncbi:YDG domain-containing protein [Phenylobacterium aquaticum]|uniref:beta strand repeat-containing protein n=1 Tax=Phenylobacterium aquaticum TaxID=1763816 RepID=UPI0026EF17D9|nr:YDG domain-containing protein [Phenylobacterium aquaticum]